MSLEQKISDFLGRADPRPGASKLEPYTELIRTLRQRRWTYVEIAGALHKDFGVTVSPSTIFAFVKVRAKRKGVQASPHTPLAPAVMKKPRFNIDA
jgi:IS30 family transposase